MLLLITIILLALGTAIMMNVYSIFHPFIDSFKDMSDYNVAYYGAVSGIERSYGVLRNHQAGFEGQGGWSGESTYGYTLDGKSNIGDINFGKLIKGNNGLGRNISSRLSGTIPQTNRGNMDKEFIINGSENFNKLEYGESEEIVLDLDNSPINDSYKTLNTVNIQKLNINSINATFRLNKIMKDGQGSTMGLGILDSTTDMDDDNNTDDVMVNRNIIGNYAGESFSVLPVISTNYPANGVKTDDQALRESYIQDFSDNNLIFGGSQNPINQVGKTNPAGGNNVIGEDSLVTKTFTDMFQNANVSDLRIKFSLINQMITASGIYPFLEYKIQVNGPAQVSDRFFHIIGNGKVGEYNVQIRIDKPVIKSKEARDFSILF